MEDKIYKLRITFTMEQDESGYKGAEREKLGDNCYQYLCDSIAMFVLANRNDGGFLTLAGGTIDSPDEALPVMMCACKQFVEKYENILPSLLIESIKRMINEIDENFSEKENSIHYH